MLALAFMTRLPVPAPHDAGSAAFARATWAWPLVGALVGGVGGLVLWGASNFYLHPLACGLLALAVQAMLTGALHEDGLADTADGLGPASRAKRLEVLRDSRVGSYGVLALVFSVGLRASLLTSLAGPGYAALALIASGSWSRALLPLTMSLFDPARADGLGKEAGRPPRLSIAVALGTGGLICVLLLYTGLGLGLLWVLGLSAAVALLVPLAAKRVFGGYTGDTLGAQQQLAEIAFLIGLAGLLQ